MMMRAKPRSNFTWPACAATSSGLAKAGYHNLPGIEVPDFVVMFVPIEPAFLWPCKNDGELWADAYKQGILLVGPTTLLYVIRIVNVLWQQERQARNVRDVMNRGTELYEKFAGFVTDMELIGDSLRKTDKHYGEAMKKLPKAAAISSARSRCSRNWAFAPTNRFPKTPRPRRC